MIKLSLVIDGNYLLYLSVFSLNNDVNLYTDLPTLLKKSLNILINKFHFEHIYFVSDSRQSWRKQFYKDYKGGRERDEKINWNEIFKIYDKFKSELTKPNITLHEINFLEGDDMVNYIVKKNNSLGISNLVISSDKDLHQLLAFNLNLNYINIITNFSHSDLKIYLPQNYNVFLNFVESNTNSSIFDLNDDNDFVDLMKDYIESSKIKEISAEQSLFVKIVSGDIGDNIQSVCLLPMKTDPKKLRGIADAGAYKVYQLYKDTYKDEIDFNSDIFIDNLLYIIRYYKKIDQSNLSLIDDIKAKIKNNIYLIRLDVEYIPEEYKTKMYNEFEFIK